LEQKLSRKDRIQADIQLSPADLTALRDGTFVGDPVRTALTKAAGDKEIIWDSLMVWKNMQPTDHNGISLKAFAYTRPKENNNE